MKNTLHKFLRWLDSPGFPFGRLYLCTSCELTFVGDRHRHCTNVHGPRLVHLASYLRKHRQKIQELSAEMQRLGHEKEEPAPRERQPAQNRRDHILALTDYRQEPNQHTSAA